MSSNKIPAGFSVFNLHVPQITDLPLPNNSMNSAITHTLSSEIPAREQIRKINETSRKFDQDLAERKRQLNALVSPRREKAPKSGIKFRQIADVTTDHSHFECFKNKVSGRCNSSTDGPIRILREINDHTCKPLVSIPLLFSAHRAMQIHKNSQDSHESEKDYLYRIELYAISCVLRELDTLKEKFSKAQSTMRF
jgi:hypothetical protein